MTDRQSTHGHDCWSWGPKHYDCAVREIERLRSIISDIKDWDCDVSGGFLSIPVGLRRRMQEAIDAQALQQDADPCPQCIPGGVCKTPTCGRALAAQAQPDAGLDVEAVLRQFLTGDGFIAECDIQHIVAALTARPAISGYTCTVPDDCETLHWRGQILSMNELASVRAEVERLQEIVRPKREDECLTLDHWRMRAYALEANWSRCSHACAIEQTKREQAEARAERLAEALRWITSDDTAKGCDDGMQEVEAIKQRAHAALEQEACRG